MAGGSDPRLHFTSKRNLGEGPFETLPALKEVFKAVGFD
jgi:hypothetical protein